MRILVIDNYDSFTYNLVQYISEITSYSMDVFRNDAIDISEVAGYDTIILSPGPGVPSDAGITPEIIRTYSRSKSILGVCLGHQAIGEVFGGQLYNLDKVFHGVATRIEVIDQSEILFAGMKRSFDGGRYHSWIVRKENLPDCLRITAVDENGIIMALSHKEFNVRGVQFHPESILTPEGKTLLKNFLEFAASYNKQVQKNNLVKPAG